MTVSVCLTIDFDGISSWTGGARHTKSPNLIARGEFGAVGALRLLDLFRARELPTTWFTPGHSIDTWPDLCERIGAEGHELGYHGYCHEGPSSKRSDADERAILEQLARGPRPTDLLRRESALDEVAFLRALFRLEQRGVLQRLPGDLWRTIRK